MPPKLGIIAGSGDLPARIIKSCLETGRDFMVAAIEGQADPSLLLLDDGSEAPHFWLRLGEAASALNKLKEYNVGELVMAGAIRRPGIADLRPDLKTAAFLTKSGAMSFGDDGLLKAVIGFIEDEGFKVVGIEDVLPDVIAPLGVIGAHKPDAKAMQDIGKAIAAAIEIGTADMGQGAVVWEDKILAREDAEGTDAMLARVAEQRPGGGVLAKVSKPGQEKRADLPTIGVRTVEAAAAAGLGGIVVEAAASLIVDKEKVIEAADAKGLYIIGIDVEDFKEKQPPLIYFIAGEPSGDALGGRLLAALKERQDIRVTGIGGPMMAEQGLASLFPMQELSVMGVAEVLPHLPKLIKRIKQTVSDIKKNKPVMLVTIDSPGFNFRVAKQLKGQGIKLVHYVAPSVWAWRPGRARKVARFLDHLLTLLPFEPPYFEREGLPTTFVGHPVIEYGADKGDGVGFRRRHQIPGDAPLLAVLPGSRAGEISRLMPVFKETVSDLAKSRNNMEVVIPVVPPMRARVETDAASWPVRVTVIGSDEKFDAFDAANAGLAASGTVALELAMSKTPSVIAYKVNVVTVWLGRILVKSPYVNLVNIILGREAVPELLFDKCRADLLAPAIAELLDNEEVRKTQNDAALEALSQLGLGGPSPSGRAADAILNLIHEGVSK